MGNDQSKMSIEEFTGFVKANFEVLGQELSDAGLALLVIELQDYPQEEILEALKRCRQECRRIALADILARIPTGHPDPEEAWAICAKALLTEDETIVRTDQMTEAFEVARHVRDNPITARMAFKETYLKALNHARANRIKPKWTLSLGFDKYRREGPILEAVRKGRISIVAAQKYLPEPTSPKDPSGFERIGSLVKEIAHGNS